MERVVSHVDSKGFLKVMPVMKLRSSQIAESVALPFRAYLRRANHKLFLLSLVSVAPAIVLFHGDCFAQEAPSSSTQVPTAEAPAAKVPEEPVDEPALQLSEAEIDALVEKLGSKQFNERESATRQLQKVGQAALPRLREAAKSKDREVRVRAEQLVKAVEERIRKSVTLKFLRETDPTLDYGMKGWKFASGIIGTTRKSRELYLQIYEADPKLIAMIEESPDTSTTEIMNYAGRMSSNIMQGVDLTVGETSLLLLTMYLPQIQDSPAMHNLVNAATFSGLFKREIILNPDETPARKIFGHWIANVNDLNASRAMLTAREAMIPESAELARRMMKKDLDDGDSMVAVSLLMLFGGKQDVELLEKWLKDETVLERFEFPLGYEKDIAQLQGQINPPQPVPLEIPGRPGRLIPQPEQNDKGEMPEAPKFEVYVAQKRDLALAALLQLAGQDLKKHFPLMSTGRRRFVSTDDVAFPESKPDVREKAFKVWDDVRARYLESEK
jgi:hypothetical protein